MPQRIRLHFLTEQWMKYKCLNYSIKTNYPGVYTLLICYEKLLTCELEMGRYRVQGHAKKLYHDILLLFKALEYT